MASAVSTHRWVPLQVSDHWSPGPDGRGGHPRGHHNKLVQSLPAGRLSAIAERTGNDCPECRLPHREQRRTSPRDTRVTVRNTRRGSQRVLPRYVADLNVSVPTLGASYYEVRAERPDLVRQDLGTTAPDQPAPLFDVATGSNGQTVISIESEWLTGSPTAIVVNQVFSIQKRDAEHRSAQGIAIRLNGATTDYRTFFVREGGIEDELDLRDFNITRVSPTEIEVLITTVDRLDADITGLLGEA